jgi:hypothetical protein
MAILRKPCLLVATHKLHDEKAAELVAAFRGKRKGGAASRAAATASTPSSWTNIPDELLLYKARMHVENVLKGDVPLGDATFFISVRVRRSAARHSALS